MFGYYLYAHASVLTIHCKTSAAIVCLYTYTDFVRFLADFLLYISNVSIITIQQQLIVSQLIQIFILKHNNNNNNNDRLTAFDPGQPG